MHASQTKIRVQELSTWYGEKQVLQNITAGFSDKCVTAIIGPSGCGKSTLLRSLNRMADLTPNFKRVGEITFESTSIYDESVDVTGLRKKIGLVFQKPNPFPFSIYDNIAFGPRLHGKTNPSELAKIVEDSLVKADLWEEVKDRLNHNALRLSGGQQQRLCIARALAIEPDVLLLDEPCSALDPISTHKIEELIAKLRASHAVVIVTHNLAQAKRVSDYTMYLLDGKLIEYGSTKQVFNKPKHKLTRDYIEGRYG